MTNGTIAVGLGKLVGGCRFQTYYPITPASDESEFLEAHPEFGMAVVQTEDEIAAVTMATGAALTGVRASTSTSGPGFCLMAEGLGWAGMNEVPVILFNYQRGGPATGLPTRHEQGDLRSVLGAGHGDFPRIALAPGDIEEYFYDSAEAFNLAERYQTPVIVLCDKALANSTQTVPAFDASAVTMDHGYLVPEGLTVDNGDNYRRFRFTEDGISPRAVLGQQGTLCWNTGDEHDEFGHISEDPNNRVRMMDKRMGKLETAAREIPLEKKVSIFGDENADLTLVSWGSNKGAILDAMEVLRAQGIRINFLQIRLLSPFPADFVADFLKRAKRTVDVEMNYTAQLAELIRAPTGIALDHFILKLAAYNKKQGVEETTEAIRLLHAHGIMVHGMFVLGADSDDAQTVRDTANFALRHKIDTVQMMVLTPLVGTREYQRLEAARGRWDLYDGHHVVFQPKRLTPAQLQVETFKAMRRFYSLGQSARVVMTPALGRATLAAGWRALTGKWKAAWNRLNKTRPVLPALLRTYGWFHVRRWGRANREFLRSLIKETAQREFPT